MPLSLSSAPGDLLPALARAFAKMFSADPLDISLSLLWVATSVLVSLLIGQLIKQFIKRGIKRRETTAPAAGLESAAAATQTSQQRSMAQRLALRACPLFAPLLNFVFLGAGVSAITQLGHDPSLLPTLRPLAASWIFAATVYAVTHSRTKTLFVAALIVPLSLPLFAPLLAEGEAFLSGLSFTIGKTTITALLVLKMIITAVLLFWVVEAVNVGLSASLSRLHHLRPSTRQLLQNLSTIGVYIIAGLCALSILGIDLTAFAVMGGAIGVGIGLGLQKISSNFISGLILLSERTIQVNDLIEIEGSPISGLVKHTGARYTLIETLDNREVLVPNDDLITNRVINSTHSNSRGLIRIDIGVAYGSDLEKVRDIIKSCASDHEGVLKDPAPACFLMGFGPSAVDFTVFAHIEDVRERKLGTKSEILFDIWKRFKTEGIEIPFPQLKVHLANEAAHIDKDSTA